MEMEGTGASYFNESGHEWSFVIIILYDEEKRNSVGPGHVME